ncbi:hypothetical protein MBLNU230_g8045t1 [Neophaeotheca triangularis]
MAVDKITPDDKRVEHKYTKLNGRQWHYLDAKPSSPQRGTVFLIHGWPDISLAWRYQIPMLLGQGLRCVALDCMGYNESDAPDGVESYTFKFHADAIAALAAELNVPKIIIMGHDWGGMVVYRAAQWYPDLISHVVSVCTPYMAVHDQFIPTEVMVKGPLPQFGYQLQLGSEEQVVEKAIGLDENKIRNFLKGVYGGQPKSGRPMFSPEQGVRLSALDEEVTMTPLLSEAELDYYVTAFKRHGLHGPCNWYRTRKPNFDDDQQIPAARRNTIAQPTLFVCATKDSVLKPEMSKGMEKSFPNLTRAEVHADHWALWHTPAETNEHIQKWVEGVVFGGKSHL